MIRWFTIFFCFFSHSGLLAEIIDGPANLRKSPNGEVLISLNHGVPIEVLGKKDNWYITRVVFFVKKKDFIGGVVRSGVVLYDQNNIQIGETINLLRFSSYSETSSNYIFELKSYTYNGNIIQASFLEDEIIRLVNDKKLDRETLSELKYIELTNWASSFDYNSWIVFDPVFDLMGSVIRFIFVLEDSRVVAMVGGAKLSNQEFDYVKSENIEMWNLTLFYLEETSVKNQDKILTLLDLGLNRMSEE